MKITVEDKEDKPVIHPLTLSKKTLKMMGDMTGSAYAVQQGWDIQAAASALQAVAQLISSESNEPDDMTTLADIMLSLVEFIKGEIGEMENASVYGQVKSAKTLLPDKPKEEDEPKQTPIPAEVLNTSYAKSLGIVIPDLAVKYVAKDQIRHPVFLWGDPNKTDLEKEYFTRETDFWDEVLGKSARPLTWDHAQDEGFDADPVIGKTIEWEDDEIGRWAISQLNKGHKYRQAIDTLIGKKSLGSAAIAMPVVGSSSDSAPQYVKRVQVGKSIWLARWPWFATALTPAPCEPRMIDSDKGIEFYKSLGVTIPDAGADHSRQLEALKLRERELKVRSFIGGS